jgi:hypothetical protein
MRNLLTLIVAVFFNVNLVLAVELEGGHGIYSDYRENGNLCMKAISSSAFPEPALRNDIKLRASKHEDESVMHMNLEKIIRGVLFKKFDYWGEQLHKEIQKIRKEGFFENLTNIKGYLDKLSQAHQPENKEGMLAVTVFVKEEDYENGNDENLRKAFLGSAYFPEELDTEMDEYPLIRVAELEFIHQQLAWAFSFAHPLAMNRLKAIAALYNVPVETNFYKLPDKDSGQYRKYVVWSSLIEEGRNPDDTHPAEAAQNTPVQMEKIPFDSGWEDPERIGKYFLDLVSQDPGEEMAK